MVKYHIYSERGNPPPPPHGPQQQGFFYMHHPTDRNAHTTAFVTLVVELWLEREIARWVHHERTLLPRSYISLQQQRNEPYTHRTMSERSYHGATSRSNNKGTIRTPIAPWARALTTELHLAPTTKERSVHPSHHERELLPRSYISLQQQRNDPYTHRTMSESSYHGATSRSNNKGTIRTPIAPWARALTTELHLAPTTKERSVHPSHHERELLPQSYISLQQQRNDPYTHRTMSESSYHRATSRSNNKGTIRTPIAPWARALTTELHLAPTTKERSVHPSHHERELLPRSYISLQQQRNDPYTHRTMSESSYHRATSRSNNKGTIRTPIAPWARALTTELHLAPTTKERSVHPSHHERELLPQSYISLQQQRNDPYTHRTMSESSYHGATSRSNNKGTIRTPIAPWARALTTELHLAPTTKERSVHPSHHERELLPQSYISLQQQRNDPYTHRTMSESSYHGATSRSNNKGTIRTPIAPWARALTTELHLAPTTKERSVHPSHHERELLPRSYISLQQQRNDPYTHRTMSESSYHGATSRSNNKGTIRTPIAPWANALTTELHLAPTTKERSVHPSHHERELLPQSYISLQQQRNDPYTHRTMSESSYHRATSRSNNKGTIRTPIAPWARALTTELHLAPTTKERSVHPSHHERELLPRSYISLQQQRNDPYTHRTMSESSYHRATSRSNNKGTIRTPIASWANALTTELHLAPTTKERSVHPSHHERELLPRSYISLQQQRNDPYTHRTMSELSYHGATSRSNNKGTIRRPMAPRSYISLLTITSLATSGNTKLNSLLFAGSLGGMSLHTASLSHGPPTGPGVVVAVTNESMNQWMNESMNQCLTTPQHKRNISVIGCQKKVNAIKWL